MAFCRESLRPIVSPLFLETARPTTMQEYSLLCLGPITGMRFIVSTTRLTGYLFSCGPNAEWWWNENTFSLELCAVRRIKHNEEITVTYIDHRTPRDTRQQKLQQAYCFTCQCAWCSLSAEESLQSDRNRHEILTWCDNHIDLPDGCATPLSTNESYVSEGKRIIEVCKKEGIENEVGSFANDIRSTG